MSRNFNIVRLQKSSGGAFAKGKYAIAICHRSGFKYPYKEMVYEPGTNYWVHRSEDDGDSSIVTHPQNYPPEKLTERVALRWAHFDVPLSIGEVPTFFVTAGEVSVGYGVSVSSGTGVSAGSSAGEGLYFSLASNSMYSILIFQGI